MARNCRELLPANKSASDVENGSDKDSVTTDSKSDGKTGCQLVNRKAAQFMMKHAVTVQGGTRENFTYLKNHVLLDNQSTADIFCNLKYLQNIREVQEKLTLYTNGGVLTCNTKGDLKGYGTVWCHPKAIANILGLSNVLNSGRYDVSFDTKTGFKMQNINTGATTVFARDEDGFFSAPLGEPTSQEEEDRFKVNTETALEVDVLTAGVDGQTVLEMDALTTGVDGDEDGWGKVSRRRKKIHAVGGRSSKIRMHLNKMTSCMDKRNIKDK